MSKQEWVSYDVCGLTSEGISTRGVTGSVKIPRVVTVYKVLDTAAGLFSNGGISAAQTLYAPGGTQTGWKWGKFGKTWNRRGDLTCHLRANGALPLPERYRILAVSFLVSQS